MHVFRFMAVERWIMLVLALLVCTTTGPVYAQTIEEPRYSLDEAVAIVKKTVEGEVVRAKITEQDARTVYEIRIVTEEGHVRDLIFDAETGLEK